jgi:hypothetical protein
MEVSGQFHSLAALTPGKQSQYPLNRRLRGSQRRSGQGDEKKNSLHCPHQELMPGSPVCSIVSILTELPRVNISLRFTLILSFHLR